MGSGNTFIVDLIYFSIYRNKYTRVFCKVLFSPFDLPFIVCTAKLLRIFWHNLVFSEIIVNIHCYPIRQVPTKLITYTALHVA